MINEKSSDVADSDAKLENYELDNHVRTMEEAHKIMGNKKLMKAVHAHAKGKASSLKKITSMLKPDENSEEAEDMKPAKSIDDIREAKKSRKKDLFGAE